ncbi:MAG: hypothetical protein FJ088_02625, partial [Deltaproteobacteria bacterium]|nr:hypothetical protein [Deltaproteobacteria bacterium]
MRNDGLKTHFLPAAVFFLSFLIFNSNFSWLPGGDSVPNRYMPFSIICNRDFDLAEFPFLYTLNGRESIPYYLTESADGAIVSTFGMGASVFSVPFYLAAMAFKTDFSYNEVLALSKITASSVSALGVLFCFFALSLFAGRRRAIAGTVVYALGTLVFSICSQGLYQHTFAVFFLTAGFYFFLKGVKEKGEPGPISALLLAK